MIDKQKCWKQLFGGEQLFNGGVLSGPHIDIIIFVALFHRFDVKRKENNNNLNTSTHHEHVLYHHKVRMFCVSVPLAIPICALVLFEVLFSYHRLRQCKSCTLMISIF